MDDPLQLTKPAPGPRGPDPRPGEWQQRWHSVLVYFGLANPYPWDEPEPDERAPEPRLTGWRRAVSRASILVVPIVVAFATQGFWPGVFVCAVAAIVMAIYSPVGEELRRRYTWVDEGASPAGFALMAVVAFEGDYSATDWALFVVGMVGWFVTILGLNAILERLEPQQGPSIPGASGDGPVS